MALRNGVVEALVGLVEDEPPEAMVQGEVQRRIEDLGHRLSHQGASLDQYLEAMGTSAQEFVEGLKTEAVITAKADLAIRAVIEAESIEVDDEAVEAELERVAAQVEQPLEKVRQQFEQGGGMRAVRSDIQRSKALEWLTEHAEVVDPDGKPVDRSLLEPPAHTENELAEEHG
jgi:trigger factor